MKLVYLRDDLEKKQGHLFYATFNIFMNEKFLILIKISLKFVPKGMIDNKPSIGLDNGLVPNMRLAIIWTKADLIHWPIYAALGGDELKEMEGFFFATVKPLV